MQQEHHTLSRTDKQQQASERATPPVLLSRHELRTFFGVSYSRAHLHRLITQGDFPAPVALGPGVSSRKAWRRADIEAWIAALKPVNSAA
jgi:predicted DNA-binding transcriptional regulator AlpA